MNVKLFCDRCNKEMNPKQIYDKKTTFSELSLEIDGNLTYSSNNQIKEQHEYLCKKCYEEEQP